MSKQHVKLIPNDDMQNQLLPIVGNRKVLHIICEVNQVDKLKIKGKMALIAKKRKVEVYCKTNNKTYPSIKQASIELILDAGAISRCISGKQESTNGYTFKRKTL